MVRSMPGWSLFVHEGYSFQWKRKEIGQDDRREWGDFLFTILQLTWQFYYITADMTVLLYYCWHASFILLQLTWRGVLLYYSWHDSVIILQLTWQGQFYYITADMTWPVLLHYSWDDGASFIILQLTWQGQFYYITADLTRPALYLCFNSDKKFWLQLFPCRLVRISFNIMYSTLSQKLWIFA